MPHEVLVRLLDGDTELGGDALLGLVSRESRQRGAAARLVDQPPDAKRLRLDEVQRDAAKGGPQIVRPIGAMASVLPRVSALRQDVPRVLDDLVAQLLSLDMDARPKAPDVRARLQRVGKELRAASSAVSTTGERTDPLPTSGGAGGSFAPTEPVPEVVRAAPVAGPRGTVKMGAFRDPLFDKPAASPAPLPVVPPPTFGPRPSAPFVAWLFVDRGAKPAGAAAPAVSGASP